MSQRSSLFASPARKTSRLGHVTTTLIDKQQEETLAKEEPMEIDATLQKNEETCITNGSVPCTSSDGTPKRRRTLSMGRRRSICVSEEGKAKNDKSKNVESETQHGLPKQEESVFDLLMSESVLDSQSNPMHELATEKKKATIYYENLEKQLNRFDAVADGFEMKLEKANKITSKQFVSPFFPHNATQILPKIKEGLTPSQMIMKSLVEFRKFAKDATTKIKRMNENKEAEENLEKARRKMEALEKLEKKYEISEEKKAKRQLEKEQLLEQIRLVRGMGNPRKIEPISFLSY